MAVAPGSSGRTWNVASDGSNALSVVFRMIQDYLNSSGTLTDTSFRFVLALLR